MSSGRTTVLQGVREISYGIYQFCQSVCTGTEQEGLGAYGMSSYVKNSESDTENESTETHSRLESKA